jgi:hypothetical protein
VAGPPGETDVTPGVTGATGVADGAGGVSGAAAGTGVAPAAGGTAALGGPVPGPDGADLRLGVATAGAATPDAESAPIQCQATAPISANAAPDAGHNQRVPGRGSTSLSARVAGNGCACRLGTAPRSRSRSASALRNASRMYDMAALPPGLALNAC